MKNYQYYGQTKEDYEKCLDLIWQSNAKNLRLAGILGLLMISTLFFVSIVLQLVSIFRRIYLIYAIVLMVFLLLTRLGVFEKHVRIQLYTLFFVLLCFGTSLALPNPADKATVYPVLLAILPTLFADRPYYMCGMIIGMDIVYCWHIVQYKAASVMQFDIFNSIVFGILAIIGHYYINVKIVQGYVSQVQREEALLAYKNAQEELKVKAQTDQMTGLYNRTFFTEAALSFFEDCKRFEGCSYLVMIDLDKFKSINDTYGHQMGDYAIVEVANILKRNVRQNEYAARLGGDEYIFLISECVHKEKIETIMDRIIGEIHNIHLKDDAYASGSAGVVKVSAAFKSYDELYKQADLALYKAKEQGGNQVVYTEYGKQ